jgi:stage II sporulation protein R
MKLNLVHKLENILTVLVFIATCLASTGLTAFNEGQSHSRFWAVQPVSASTVRLHVIADSNEPESQMFKMQMVEQVQRLLTEDRPRWAGRDYQQYLLENLEWLEHQLLQYAGTLTASPPGIEARLVREKFPLRAYGHSIYPPGEYTALQVIIGAGNGDNWWCLLFPPLCLPFAQTEEPDEKQVMQNNPGEQAGSGSALLSGTPPQEEAGGWKFFITERWCRWFRNN